MELSIQPNRFESSVKSYNIKTTICRHRLTIWFESSVKSYNIKTIVYDTKI